MIDAALGTQQASRKPQANEKAARARRELARRARLELARQKLTPFCSYIDPDAAKAYEAAHLAHLAEKLEAVERGEILRLMVFMPNRHWKSSLSTMKFPAWFIGKRATAGQPHQVMLISHTADKADEFSEYTRNLIKDQQPAYNRLFPNLRISRTRQSAGEWGLLDKDGQEEAFPTMVTGSMERPPTGSGADLLIIDDPVKSSRDARSASVQEMHQKSWTEGLRTRLNDPERSAVVLIMTRWAVNDIAGWLLKTMQNDPLADQWEVVALPALAYTSNEVAAARKARLPLPEPYADPLGRKPGEALWPDKFTRGHHLATKANSPSAFSSIGQQMPIQEGGNLLGREHFKVLPALPTGEIIRWVIPVDVAYKERHVAKDDPDWNVFGLLGFWMPQTEARTNMRLILGGLVRTQMGLNAAKEIAPLWAAACATLTGQRPPIIAAQATLDKILLDDLRGMDTLAQWSIRSLDDPYLKRRFGSFVGDKVSKFEPWRDRAIGERFYVMDEAWSRMALLEAFPDATRRRLFGDEPLAWHEKFFTEVEGFPDWNHDDMVDMVSVGYHVAGMGTERQQRKARSYQG